MTATTETTPPTLLFSKPKWSELLISYFYSGWAFLIPYLAAYLLYAWLKWPANPTVNGQQSAVSSQFSWVPCLLYVYWFLHVVHMVLGGIALIRSWRTADKTQGIRNAELRDKQSAVDRLWPLAPWLLLGLIFWIPEVYLEWPADPWEHLRRITEWSIHPLVSGHSAGYKSFYFFAYSFISIPPNLSRFGNVNLYGTCIDLLLAWQYFRLAKTVGLNGKWAFLFVLANALTFGNVCFSFYKYYTLSTTIYSQLGAVALVRITLGFVQKIQTGGNTSFHRQWTSQSTARYIFCFILLLAMVAFNHVQGLGIAGLGIGSIVIWRLIEWKRSAILWVLAAVGVLSVATILWWPRPPTVDVVYRQEGWLNSWYGFNLFAWPSPSADRAMQILGLLGLMNLLAGISLLRRNHIAGWLTVGPIFALTLPFVALPLANSLAAISSAEIITFHRMFFAIPQGLAIVALLQQFESKLTHSDRRQICDRHLSQAQNTSKSAVRNVARRAETAIIILLLGAALTVPATSQSFNRTWHTLAAFPNDLTMKPLWKSVEMQTREPVGKSSFRIASTSIAGFIIDTEHPGRSVEWGRGFNSSKRSPADDFGDTNYLFRHPRELAVRSMMVFDPAIFFTPYSFAAVCSQHWPSQEAVLATSGSHELKIFSREAGFYQQTVPGAVLFFPAITR